MDIYIDESGAFIVSPDANPRVSCVAAVVLPTNLADTALGEFAALPRNSWGYTDEVKGSKLNEEQFAELIGLLRRHDVLVEICAVDAGSQKPGSVQAFKLEQAHKLREAVGPKHHPNLVREFNELARRVEALPDQLFLQLFATTVLIDEVIRHSTLYYVQRQPEELGTFNWCLDAKDRAITEYEQLWQQLMFPLLQTLSLEEPTVQLEGADYSHWKRFSSNLIEMPEYLRDGRPTDADKPFIATDLRKVMKHLSFAQSSNVPGLQLADCMASAFSRAMNGTLKPQGWKDLGSLIVGKQKDRLSVRLINLDVNVSVPGPPVRKEHRVVLEQIRTMTKPMLLRKP